MIDKIQGFKISKITDEDFKKLPSVDPEIYFNAYGIPFLIVGKYKLKGQRALTLEYHVGHPSRVILNAYGNLGEMA